MESSSLHPAGEPGQRHVTARGDDRQPFFIPRPESSIYSYVANVPAQRHATPHGDSPRAYFPPQPDPVYSRAPPREPERRHVAPPGNNTRFDFMPPPDTIPVSQSSRPPPISRDASRPLPDGFELKPDVPTPPRFTPVKHAGFKPISHTSSALKKFFPTDDDEMESASDDHASLPTSTQPPFEPFSAKPPVFPDENAMVNRVGRNSKFSAPESPKPSMSPPHPFVPMDPIPVENPQIAVSPTSQVLQDHDSTDIPPTPSISSRGELYNIVSQVGEGTFGKVYKAQNTVTKLYVALKRIRMESEKDGFPVTAMREIKLLQSLRHPNVVRLYEMMVSNGLSFRTIVIFTF